jgi:hypothetical protein
MSAQVLDNDIRIGLGEEAKIIAPGGLFIGREPLFLLVVTGRKLIFCFPNLSDVRGFSRGFGSESWRIMPSTP